MVPSSHGSILGRFSWVRGAELELEKTNESATGNNGWGGGSSDLDSASLSTLALATPDLAQTCEWSQASPATQCAGRKCASRDRPQPRSVCQLLFRPRQASRMNEVDFFINQLGRGENGI